MIDQHELEKLARTLLDTASPFTNTKSIEQLKKDMDEDPDAFMECLSDFQQAWQELHNLLYDKPEQP
jgi:hypothetical protein